MIVLGNLPYGRYRLQVSKSGFATQSVTIDVQSATPVTRGISMEIGSQAAKVDVVSETPLAGTDLQINQIAAPVQTATAADIENSGALDLGDFMNRGLNGVYRQRNAGNPFQPDVNYRGYTASPSARHAGRYFGVRGRRAAESAVRRRGELGSDPEGRDFGNDTDSRIGSAIRTEHAGRSNLGDHQERPHQSGMGWGCAVWQQRTQGGGGRVGRRQSHGVQLVSCRGLGFHESGWRYDSPSDVRQGFARLGWRTSKTDLALTMSYAYNTLLGNGVQDYRLLAANYTSGYSVSDSTANRSPSFNFIARHSFSDNLTFTGNAWYRNIRTETINPNFNGDVVGNDIYQPTPDEQAVLAAAGYTGFPTSGANITNTPFPYWACIAEAITPGGSPDSTCDGVNVYSKEVQNEYGFSGQFTWITNPAIGRNQFAAGASIDRNNITYSQTTDFSYVLPNYSFVSVPAWQDGSTVDGDGNPIDTQVGFKGHAPNWSLYFADTLTLGKKVNVTVSGRYNYDRVNNLDLLNPIAGVGSLTGDYTFQRFNPAVGITWSPIASVNAYARFAQGSRAPTSIELGCADPNAPCSLPNSLSSDPPLQQVVTDTWEVGLRGKPEIARFHNLSWNVGAFRDENHNDILFIAAPEIGTGYFQNFAKTLREGVDADLDGRIGPVTWGFDWTFLSATYQSVETLDGSANNTNSVALLGYPGLDGNITVHPGNRIPVIPKHTGKAYAIWQATHKLMFEMNEVIASSSYARGNENNAYTADGVYYVGPGVSPGYAVTNFRAHYDLTRHLQLAVQIDNLFNREYYTAAWLSNTVLTAQGAFQSMAFPAYADGPDAGSAPSQSVTFFAPGAPRRAWVELKLRF